MKINRRDEKQKKNFYLSLYPNKYLYGKENFFSPSVIDECKENTIILNGFSKAFVMTGWRLGVAVGPEKIINKMNLMLNTIVSCVPPFIQIAGIEAINGNQDELIDLMRQNNFSKCSYRNLSGGIVSIHSGWKI